MTERNLWIDDYMSEEFRDLMYAVEEDFYPQLTTPEEYAELEEIIVGV